MAAKVTPALAVINPEIVGVAVQAVGTTVRPEPSIVEVNELEPTVILAVGVRVAPKVRLPEELTE